MNLRDTYDADRQYGLIVAISRNGASGTASLAKLILNYHYGLDAMEASNQREAFDLLGHYAASIRCVVLLPAGDEDTEAIAGLSRSGEIPLLLICHGAPAEGVYACLPNVYALAGDTGLSAQGSDMPQLIDQALQDSGLEKLYDGRGPASAAVQRRAVRLIRDLDTLPTLPQVVMQIMRLMADPTSSVADLEKLLIVDPAIVHKLVQVVNSPLFAPTGSERGWTLKDAVVRIGWKEVATIAQQVVLVSSFVRPQDSGFDLKRFWVHSLGCAVIADQAPGQR